MDRDMVAFHPGPLTIAWWGVTAAITVAFLETRHCGYDTGVSRFRPHGETGRPKTE